MDIIKYFKAVIRYEVEAGNRMKVIKEEYLVDGISPLEVESTVVEKLAPSFKESGNDFEVISVTPTKIVDVL